MENYVHSIGLSQKCIFRFHIFIEVDDKQVRSYTGHRASSLVLKADHYPALSKVCDLV